MDRVAEGLHMATHHLNILHHLLLAKRWYYTTPQMAIKIIGWHWQCGSEIIDWLFPT
jgi:hypothetical protein